MYLEFHGLKRRPFDMTPDPSFFFPSQKHTEALASLIYAVTEKRGFVVITGEIGSGKTTVCRTLLQKLEPSARVAVITNPTLTAKQLLEAICAQFRMPTEKRTKVALLTALNRFLVQENDAGNTVVLILDEAQNLSVRALEEMRLISNMETDTQKLVQIMLLGQPELRDKLNQRELEQLRQRISLRYHLRSLDKKETRQYIEHRLSVAGDGGRVKFTKGAVDSLYEFSGGTPRLINVACDQALLTAYLRETRRIDRTIIEEIAAEFKGPSEDAEGEPDSPPTQQRAFGFWKFFWGRRGRSRRRREAADVWPPPDRMKEDDDENCRARPNDEAELLRKLTELKLAGISPENGAFVATVNGVHLRAGTRLFGMSVVRVDEDRIVLSFGEKRYQLTIESQASDGKHNTTSRELGAETNTEARLLDT